MGTRDRKSPAEITSVLKALAQTEAVVIGGQAVNLWAERYQKECPPWNELRPYTSFDLDVLGSRADVLKCSVSLDTEPFFPLPGENTVNSGKIVTQIEGSAFEIDFLHSPNGLSPAEIKELARSFIFEGISLKVLHPLHCLESKTVNLMTLSQNDGDRQDLKHLRLALAIMKEYLGHLTVAGNSEPILLRWARRIRSNSNHELGLQAAIKYRIDFQEAIPSALWLQHPGCLADFMNHEWPTWTEEIAEKKSDLCEVDNWIKSLNSKSSNTGKS